MSQSDADFSDILNHKKNDVRNLDYILSMFRSISYGMLPYHLCSERLPLPSHLIPIPSDQILGTSQSDLRQSRSESSWVQNGIHSHEFKVPKFGFIWWLQSNVQIPNFAWLYRYTDIWIYQFRYIDYIDILYTYIWWKPEFSLSTPHFCGSNRAIWSPPSPGWEAQLVYWRRSRCSPPIRLADCNWPHRIFSPENHGSSAHHG